MKDDWMREEVEEPPKTITQDAAKTSNQNQTKGAEKNGNNAAKSKYY